MKDCAEVWRYGLEAPGVYAIDPSGDYDVDKVKLVYCKNGWTYILQRGQHGNAQDVNGNLILFELIYNLCFFWFSISIRS